YGVEAAATDAVTTSALRDLEQRTREALDRASEEAVAGGRLERDPNAELIAELRALRRELDDLTRRPGDPLDPRAGQAGGQAANERGQPGQPGQQGEPGQQDPQGPLEAQQQGGQPGNAQQGGAQQGGQQAGGAQPGGAVAGGDIGRSGGYGPRGGFYDPNSRDVWGPYPYGAWRDPQRLEEARERLQTAGTDLLTLGNRLRSEGLSAEELEAIRRLGEALRNGLTGNEALIERELRSLQNLID